MPTCPHGLPHDPARFVKANGECWECYRAGRGKAGVAAKPPARVGLPLLRPPCAHEGPVVEGCRTCGTAADREARHVRLCGHPTADRDKCTRDHPGSLLQRCGTCPDYEAAAPPTGNAAG